MLGVLYAALGAFTFALNNVTMRRGVVTGSVLQGMALTVPIGGLSFLVMTIAFGELGQLVVFPTAALTWLACQGVVHFVIGRYCNYKSNQLMGVNLDRPGRPAAGAVRDDAGGGDAAREIHRAAGDRLGFDAGRLLHHPEQCRQGQEEGIGAADGGDAHPDRTLAGGAGGPGAEADLPAARVLRLHLRSGRGDVLWQLAPDGPPGLPARARHQHGGRRLRRLCGGDTVLLADPAQARLLGRHQVA